MARRGDELTQPGGYRLRFTTTSADSGGALLEMDVTYPARSRPPAAHLHPLQEETFRVLQGMLRTEIGGARRDYGPGETFVVPRGTPHAMHAAADDPTRFVWQVRPALATEAMFEKVWRLAADGKTDGRGTPSLLQGAVLMQAYAREFRLVRPARWLQVPLFAVLGPIGRALGYRAR
jgi:quercetin dioxygenase-like cupin family protein